MPRSLPWATSKAAASSSGSSRLSRARFSSSRTLTIARCRDLGAFASRASPRPWMLLGERSECPRRGPRGSTFERGSSRSPRSRPRYCGARDPCGPGGRSVPPGPRASQAHARRGSGRGGISPDRPVDGARDVHDTGWDAERAGAPHHATGSLHSGRIPAFPR